MLSLGPSNVNRHLKMAVGTPEGMKARKENEGKQGPRKGGRKGGKETERRKRARVERERKKERKTSRDRRMRSRQTAWE